MARYQLCIIIIIIVLEKILSDIDAGERLLLFCGDMNGHVGAEVDGFEGVHGGYGFVRRNKDGEMLLELADAACTGLCYCEYLVQEGGEKDDHV